MYYYGYNSSYNPGYYQMPYTPCSNYSGGSLGYTGAIILVLFILLVVVFGAGFINNPAN